MRRPSGGTPLAKRLDEAGMTLVETAAACGVDRSQVFRWRTGRAPLPEVHARTLGRYLGIDPDTLMAEARPRRWNGGTR